MLTMINNPASSWLLACKAMGKVHLIRENSDCNIFKKLHTKIRDKYLPKVDERRAYGPPQGTTYTNSLIARAIAIVSHRQISEDRSEFCYQFKTMRDRKLKFSAEEAFKELKLQLED